MQIPTISGRFRLGVILRLGVPQFVILALRVRQQRLVRARLHNLTLIKHRENLQEERRRLMYTAVLSPAISLNFS